MSVEIHQGAWGLGFRCLGLGLFLGFRCLGLGLFGCRAGLPRRLGFLIEGLQLNVGLV